MSEAEDGVWRVGEREVEITRPEAVWWAGEGVTKGEVLEYYREMAGVMLPYFRERPATVRVCPKVAAGPCYYRRELPGSAPAWLRGVAYTPETTGEEIRLPLIDEAAGLIWFANIGAIEFHLWASRAPELAKPDQVIFDLDPGEDVPYADVLRAGLVLREALAERGLTGYAKTTGGSGLHVVAPIAVGPAFEAVREWVKRLAAELAEAQPDLIAVAKGATHREPRVTVDYAQNSVGRNTAAPYTLRAEPGAQVSTPISWDEVAAGKVRPADFTLRTVPDRVRELGELFAPTLGGGQTLSGA